MQLRFYFSASTLLVFTLGCTSGEINEPREERSFGLDLDWVAIYESNFEPTAYFSNLIQNLVPVVISAVAGLMFGPFYLSPTARVKREAEESEEYSSFPSPAKVAWLLRSFADLIEQFHRLDDEL